MANFSGPHAALIEQQYLSTIRGIERLARTLKAARVSDIEIGMANLQLFQALCQAGKLADAGADEWKELLDNRMSARSRVDLIQEAQDLAQTIAEGGDEHAEANGADLAALVLKIFPLGTEPATE